MASDRVVSMARYLFFGEKPSIPFRVKYEYGFIDDDKLSITKSIEDVSELNELYDEDERISPPRNNP